MLINVWQEKIWEWDSKNETRWLGSWPFYRDGPIDMMISTSPEQSNHVTWDKCTGTSRFPQLIPVCFLMDDVLISDLQCMSIFPSMVHSNSVRISVTATTSISTSSSTTPVPFPNILRETGTHSLGDFWGVLTKPTPTSAGDLSLSPPDLHEMAGRSRYRCLVFLITSLDFQGHVTLPLRTFSPFGKQA